MKLARHHARLLTKPMTLIVLCLCSSSALTGEQPDGAVPQPVAGFLARMCLDCHNDEASKGDLNLAEFPWRLNEVENRQRWILIHDRIAKGEMPPDAKTASDTDRQQLLSELRAKLHDADYADVRKEGRGLLRRLTRDEYEQNLRDLLRLPHLDVRDILPPDREKDHCNKVAEVLDVSRVQLAAYLDAADTALRSAVANGFKPREATHQRFLATRMFQEAQTFGGREAMFYAKNLKMVPLSGADLGKIRQENSHDPQMEVAIFRSASWPYYGYPEGFIAAEPGEYHVRFSARAVRQVRDFRIRPALRSIAMTFRARKRSGPDVSGDVRATGGLFDITPEVAEYETTIRLKKNETFEYSLLGLPVPRPINPDDGPLYYDFPPMPETGHPGVAFQWLELTGPIDSQQWPPASHAVLFDELPIRAATKGSLPVELASEQPEREAVRLLRRFLQRAQRRPIAEDVAKVYEQLVIDQLESGEPLAEALIAGYSAFLCSGQFIYLQEPVDSDHYAVASRLSHFLSNTRPDPELMARADAGEMFDQDVLKSEADRLIADDGFHRFVANFTDQWLSLKDIRRDEPDVRLYPEYRFDDYLIESMEAETRRFVMTMIRDNLPITTLIDSDFVFINDRLTRHYDLPPVSGSRLRRVKLPPSSPYGGLITQASIMKVTANGTATSPILRGAWIMDRILGDPPPPPPASVPAIEPDIRGATSIREQLALHAKDPTCAACHSRFDPVGLALENFDIMGAWRDRYRSLSSGEQITGIDRAGHNFIYHVAGAVDPSGKLRDGRTFANIEELRTLLIDEPRQLSRNLLHRLTVYATGTPIRFSDREVIESILDRCSENGYRTRDLIHELVQSRIFLGTH